MLTDKDLRAALSDVFVDNQIYYKYIISVVKNFPTEDVEKTHTQICHARLLLNRFACLM